MELTREQKCLKAVLLLRKVNRYTSKEQQLAEVLEWHDNKSIDIDAWIQSMKEDYAKTPEQLEKEREEYWDMVYKAELEEAKGEYDERHYTPSATAGDYSPSCPWNAPGMSISDFI